MTNVPIIVTQTLLKNGSYPWSNFLLIEAVSPIEWLGVTANAYRWIPTNRLHNLWNLILPIPIRNGSVAWR